MADVGWLISRRNRSTSSLSDAFRLPDDLEIPAAFWWAWQRFLGFTGEQSFEDVRVAAAQVWAASVTIAVDPIEIENAKMKVVEGIVDELSLPHFGPLHWVPGERDIGRSAIIRSFVAVDKCDQRLE